jgi:hypothetical protein
MKKQIKEKTSFIINTGSKVIKISCEEDDDGNQFLNIRECYKTNDGQWGPTKKGIFISASYLPEIISDLQKLLDTIDPDSSYDL